jgi:ATP-dependent DNA helicase RecQ
MLERAEVVLLAGEEDDAIADYFIEGAFPSEEELHGVISVLDQVEDATVPRMQQLLNLSRGAIEHALKTLEVEGAVSRDEGRYVRTPVEWAADSERMEQVTVQRMHERDRMAEFVETDGCLMSFLRAELDDPVSEPCGRCANCAGSFAAEEPEEAAVQDALLFLRRAHRPIEPRKQWPAGLDERHGRIPAEHCLLEGRALSVYGDAGWGKLVKAGKYGEESFDDELIEAVIAEPVFLIDDMVDSGWSLTVCGVLLAEAGSGPVVPIALAETSKGAQ